MKRCVVTGAGGFIGFALCRELANQGIEVFSVVRPSTKANIAKLASFTKLVECNLAHIQDLSHMIQGSIDAFFHLAWDGSSGKALCDAERQMSNIQWTCEAVHAASNLGAKRFVFAASLISREALDASVSEEWMAPNTIYGAAKLAASLMARSLCEELQISYCEAVISNAFGPGEDSPRLVNSTIRKLLSGEHCAFTSATQLYDFIYIDDAARALAAIGEFGIARRAYYLGTEVKLLRSYLEALRDEVNPDAELGFGELVGQERFIDYSAFDQAALRRDTGFTPCTTFDVGIALTRDWIKEHG